MRVTTTTDERVSSGAEDRITAAEDRAMRAAIRLARRGFGTTHPNPRVGAVILCGGEVVGTGYHARAGEAHAEAAALAAAGGHADGGTLITTLEPCAHQGRTPPCVDSIAAAGIRRVVLGMRDPNPLVNGRGARRLRAAGIEVVEGVRSVECRALNRPYLKHLATGLPWVMLKSMVSLDGRVASDSGESRGLGGDAEQRLCHRLRAEHDAVVVGIGTVLADDPELTVRLGRGRNPLRVVLDSNLRIPLGSRLVETVDTAPLVIATTSDDRGRIQSLESRGVSVWRFERSGDGRVPLQALLARLSGEGCLSVLVEGGPAVHTAFLRERLADRVAIGIAPLILGGSKARSWTRDLGGIGMGEAIEVGSLTTRRVGRDIWVEGALGTSGEDDV